MLYTKEDLELAYSEGYNRAYDELESMLESDNNEYSLEDECNYYMESSSDNKKQYAVVSLKAWGTFIGGLKIDAFNIAYFNRIHSVYSSDTISDAVFRWLDHNHIRKIKYDHKKKSIEMDRDWYNDHKDDEIIFLECPPRSVTRSLLSNKNTIRSPYHKHGGLFSKNKWFKWTENLANDFEKNTGIVSKVMTFDQICKKAGIKIKLSDQPITGRGINKRIDKIIFGNEETITAVEQAYLEMLTKDDKDAIRGVNHVMSDADVDKDYKSNFNKMAAAMLSKKKNGEYTLNKDRAEKYVSKKFKKFMDKKNYNKMINVDRDDMHKYDDIKHKMNAIFNKRETYDKQHKS